MQRRRCAVQRSRLGCAVLLSLFRMIQMTFLSAISASLNDPSGRRRVRTFFILALCSATGGCGVLAAPCRVTSAALKMVPLVGHVAALPTDGCAAVIDP